MKLINPFLELKTSFVKYFHCEPNLFFNSYDQQERNRNNLHYVSFPIKRINSFLSCLMSGLMTQILVAFLQVSVYGLIVVNYKYLRISFALLYLLFWWFVSFYRRIIFISFSKVYHKNEAQEEEVLWPSKVLNPDPLINKGVSTKHSKDEVHQMIK